MPRKRISANLRRAAVAPVARIAVYPVLEQDVAQFVGQCTALPHGIPGARDTNEYGSASWVPHCQTMLVWARVEHGHVDPSRLFDDLQKITQRLHSEMMILTEPRSGRAALRLRSQRFLPLISSLAGSPDRPGSRPIRGNAAALRACRPCPRGSYHVPRARPAQLPSLSQPVQRPWLPSPTPAGAYRASRPASPILMPGERSGARDGPAAGMPQSFPCRAPVTGSA